MIHASFRRGRAAHPVSCGRKTTPLWRQRRYARYSEKGREERALSFHGLEDAHARATCALVGGCCSVPQRVNIALFAPHLKEERNAILLARIILYYKGNIFTQLHTIFRRRNKWRGTYLKPGTFIRLFVVDYQLSPTFCVVGYSRNLVINSRERRPKAFPLRSTGCLSLVLSWTFSSLGLWEKDEWMGRLHRV